MQTNLTCALIVVFVHQKFLQSQSDSNDGKNGLIFVFCESETILVGSFVNNDAKIEDSLLLWYFYFTGLQTRTASPSQITNIRSCFAMI